MKLLKNLIKFVLPVLLFGFLIYQLLIDWNSLEPYLNEFRYQYVFLSLFILFFVYPEGAYCWYLIMKGNNINLTLRKLLMIWIISNTGRYLPGKVWQYVGRVELAKKHGVDRNITISSLLLETFLVMVSATICATLVLPYIIPNLKTDYILLALVIPAILLHPSIANKAIDLLSKLSNKKISKFELTLSFKNTLVIIPWFILNFVINGIALVLIIQALGYPIEISDSTKIIGFYALAWILGFISIISPAGIGITEVSLTYFLTLLGIPVFLASAISITHRVLLTISEVFVFLYVIKIKDDK